MTPKAFTEAQRGELQDELARIGRDHFSRYGYRRTNIADIAGEAGIGKGTFYLFFGSKAELFVTIAAGVEADLRAWMAGEMEKPFDTPRARIVHFLRSQLEVFRDHPFLRIVIDPDEARSLFRELPEGAAEGLMASDDAHFSALVEEWRGRGWIGAVDPPTFGAACRALYAMSLHPDMVGEDRLPAALELVIQGLADRLDPEGRGAA